MQRTNQNTNKILAAGATRGKRPISKLTLIGINTNTNKYKKNINTEIPCYILRTTQRSDIEHAL